MALTVEVAFLRAVILEETNMERIKWLGFSNGGNPASAACIYVCSPWRDLGPDGETHMVWMLAGKACMTLTLWPLYYDHKLKFRDLIYYSQVLIGFKYRQGNLPNIFNNLLKYSYESGDRSVREDYLNFHIPKSNGSGKRYPLIDIIKSWNRLPYYYKSEFDTKFFKIMVKQYLNERYNGFVCEKIKCYACGIN